MPTRAPNVLMSVVMYATTAGPNAKKAPLKNPKRMQNAMMAAWLVTAIQHRPVTARPRITITATVSASYMSAK